MKMSKELLVPNVNQMNKRREQKNGFTITANNSTHSHRANQHKGEEDLVRKVRMLEYELKRKINEDGLMKNLFKTKQSHEMSHIDLYLQLRSLEEQYNKLLRQ